MNNDSTQNQIAPRESQTVETLSLYKDGFNFHFEVGKHQVHAWASAISSSEKLFIDGKIQSKKRSFTKRSIHHFEFGGDQYELEFQVISMMTGELHCTLIKNGVHVNTLKQIPKLSGENDSKSNKWITAAWFAIGLIMGFGFLEVILAEFF